jgi:nitrate reductase NapE component
MSFAAAMRADGSAGRNISVMAFLHTAIVLFPIVAITLPKPSGHTFGRDIWTSLISMSNLVVAPCFVTLQFYAQYQEMRSQHGRPGALSLPSLGLQVLIAVALAIRWLLRLGDPTWDRNLPVPIWLWYQWGFPAINYALHALGCAFLLVCYLFTARGTAGYGLSEDRLPLLG